MKKSVRVVIIILITSIAVLELWKSLKNTRESQTELNVIENAHAANTSTQALVAVNNNASGAKEDSLNDKTRDVYNNLKELHLKGKTIDAEGNPVPDVNVKVSWDKAGWLVGAPDHGSVMWVKSDEKGEWSLVLKKTLRAYVDGASKEGYEYIYSDDSSKNLAEAYNSKEVGRFVVRLRKKAEEGVLLVNPESGYGRTRVLEVVAPHSATGQIDVLDDKTQNRDSHYWDLFVQAKYESSSTSWQISFFVTNQVDGVVASDELLYESPQDGYKKEVIFIGATQPRYLYLKTRSPSLYSRINLDYYQYREHPNTRLRITYKAFTNPYGERSFEDAQELRKFTFARDELIEEAKKAIQSGALPKKPGNLEAHLEEREKAIRKAKNIPMR